MTNEKKIALALAGTLLLGGVTTSLSACSSKEDNEKQIVSETSIDSKDIVIIDAYNEAVSSKGLTERYLILYKIGTQHDEKLDIGNNISTSYIYRDVKNKGYIGVFTEYTNNKMLFAYAKEDMTGDKTILVPITDDKSWYGKLENIIEKDSLKIAYEVSELLEIYDILNQGYLKENNDVTYNNTEKLSYTYEIN